MDTYSKETIFKNYLDWLAPHAHHLAQVHTQLLALRQQGLRQATELISRQLQSFQPQPRERFSLADLKEFAEGDVTKCLGERYAVYNSRRCPRIPNGDLLLMSRILDIQGQPGQFDQPTSITAEYDVPENAWYLEAGSAQLPISIYLEIALQPCGFLSAFLGTPLHFPDVDFFFRNLDGQVQLTAPVDVRDKTIQTRATLLETVFSGTTIIQHFSFELSCEELVFFKGRSSFGFFPNQSMDQVGLDGGKPSVPWLHDHPVPNGMQTLPGTGAGLPDGNLRLIEQVAIDKNGGANQAGYVYASRPNAPTDWYYACHFYQDPVMPGSLGIEAIVQAMTTLAREQGYSQPDLSMAMGQEMTWKYRGQVLQKNRQMQVEVHFRKSQATNGTPLLSGDASLWADDIRIYEVHNVTLALQEPRP
jgi:3-hydroxymyristoyl/3-hydroxydecanoyl-(acyl carrier protein) dehydratase